MYAEKSQMDFKWMGKARLSSAASKKESKLIEVF